MNLVRRNPWHSFDQLSNDLDTLFQRLQRPVNDDDSNVVTSRWTPAVDIKEEDQQFVLLADVPGIDPKDIDITMDNNVLTIKGERSQQTRQEGKEFQRVERVVGTFYRRFSLPDSADAEGIEARGENGVLTITIPKKQKAQPRRISVAA